MKNLSKQLVKYSVMTILISLLSACNSDDDSNSQQNPLFGQWEITSGDFIYGSDQFTSFNSNGTVDIFRETEDGFRGKFSPTYRISGDEVIIDGVGGQGDPGTFSYTLEAGVLTLSAGMRTIVLQRMESAFELSSWITELSVLSVGNAPYNGEVDMAFTYDKSAIVYGRTNASDAITLVDPNTFEIVGNIPTTHSAQAVEVEKFNSPDRYVFQSDNGSARFYGYFEDTNRLDVTSIELGAWIGGLASVNDQEVWASSNNESSIYLYNYLSQVVNKTIELDIQPQGLDYQNGFLYVSDGSSLHKCQVSPSFEVLESYTLPNMAIDGIAFDGINFWVNGYDFSNDAYKLIKTSLTL